MSARALFRRRPAGLHAADPLTRNPETPVACKACSPLDYGPCTCPRDCRHLSCTGRQREEPHGNGTPETLVEQAPRSGDVPGAMPAAFSIAADYRALPVFRDAMYAACDAGLTGLGTRRVHPVPPVPDYGLDRFTVGAGDDDFGPEFDQIAGRAAAGFYEASRVFHSADTAGFPAVAS